MSDLNLILLVLIPVAFLLLKLFITWEILGLLIKLNNILRKVEKDYDDL